MRTCFEIFIAWFVTLKSVTILVIFLYELRIQREFLFTEMEKEK